VFLHGFEERGLGFRSGAIDFVAEQEVAENGSGREFEAGAADAIVDEDLGADEIGGHEIRGELDSLEAEVQSAGERADEERFAQAGNAFEEDVSAGDHGDDGVVDDVFLADDDFANLALELLKTFSKLVELGVEGGALVW
jgi:hypothetical protein